MTSEIRQRKAADDASEEKVDDGEQKNINIGELTTALRRAKNPRATYLGDRLQSYDKDGDGEIDAEELGKIMDGLVEEEKSNIMLRKFLIAAAVTMVIMMASIFGLSWATASLAKDVSTDESDTHLTSAKTGRKLATIAEGGGGMTVSFTPEDESQRMLQGDMNDTMMHDTMMHDATCEEHGNHVGTLDKIQVQDAYDKAITSSTPIRSSWKVDDTTYNVFVNTNMAEKTSMDMPNPHIMYTNLLVDAGDPPRKYKVTVVCPDDQEDCGVCSHQQHDPIDARRLARAFPRQLFGAPQDEIAEETCHLGDFEHEDDDAPVEVSRGPMKANALQVNNQEAFSQILKDAAPITTRALHEYISAFNEAKAEHDDVSEYDLINNSCLNFPIKYIQALGEKLESKHMVFIAKRLSDNIPDLASRIINDPTVVEHASHIVGDNDSDFLVRLMKFGFLSRKGPWGKTKKGTRGM